MTILVATGLLREKRLLAGPGLEVVAGGGDHAALEAALDRLAAGARGIVSMGIAGALSPELRPGQWVIATSVLDKGQSFATDAAWTDRLLRCLPAAGPGTFLGSDTMIADAAEKAELHRATGAIAVDMESHVAARVARRHRLPFAAARVVSDAADRTLPPAARLAMKADGAIDLPSVLRSLLSNPGQLLALIRTGIEAEKAFRALLRGHDLLGPGLLGPGLGGSYIGELPLDVV